MEPTEVSERLANLDSAFKGASSSPMGYDNELPEPGDYQTLFTAVHFFEKKAAPHNAFLKLTFEIQDDALYTGREISMIYNLEPHKVAPGQPAPTAEEVEQKLSFLKRDLKTMDIDVDAEDFSFSEVRPGSAIWDDPLDSPFLVAVRDSRKVNPNTGKPYRNAYLNERLGKAIPPDIPVEDPPVQVAGGDPGEDIPFAPSMF